MSAPPPYGGSGPQNPDPRELPPGWISQWDSNFNAWFYVNTREQPPRSSWVHPLGALPARSPPPQQFAPPTGAPPPNRDYNRSPYGDYNQGGWQGQQPPQSYGGPPGGYGGGYQPSYGGAPGGYGGAPQGEYRGAPGGYGGPGGGYPQEQERGWFGGGQSRPSYQQQPPPAPPKKSGPGIGTAILAGGAGLLGGALLADAWEDHNENEREEGYDQGFQNGADDYGGGDYDGDNW